MKQIIYILLFISIAINAKASCDLHPKFGYKTKGLSTQFTNKTLGNYSHLEWSFGDGNTSNEANPKHTYTDSGVKRFSLTVFSTEGCNETFEGKVYVFHIAHPVNNSIQQAEAQELASAQNTDAKTQNSALANNKTLQNLHNFPNPVETQTTITFDLSETTDVLVQLFDLSGKMVALITDERLTQGHHNIPFRRRQLASGTYVLNVNTSEENYSHKIVVQ